MDTAAAQATTSTQENQSGSTSQDTNSQPSFSWKGQLNPDFANSPTMQKFADTKEGFNSAIQSHLSLEKMLGKDKVVIPKDEKDVEGWNAFSKAMGIPDKAEGYGLADPDLPQAMKGVFNKQKFAEVAHAFKLTPSQAKGLYDAYLGEFKSSYENAVKSQEAKMQDTINRLRGEWGDAYQTNVDLGQMVINKFSSDQETQDFITATILSNPNGVKFLSKIGNQFAENKIGEFGYQKFSLTPDQAEQEWLGILNNPKDPYNDDKAHPELRSKRIDYVNSLIAAVNKGKG